jgi:serine/threonine protein kinase
MGSVRKLKDDIDIEEVSDHLQPGDSLLQGQFTIESFLNSGGFGITYTARDSLDRKVVIKECFPNTFCQRTRAIVRARSREHQADFQSIVKLFVQEAKSLSRLKHPNIVGVHQVFEDNHTAYMALDFVDGRDLHDTLSDPNHGLKPTEIKSILIQLLEAVSFMHSQKMLHRDISPDNILLDANNKPILIDFGAARQQMPKSERAMSAFRVVKDGYSPQEFYLAGSPQYPCSDLYALAATFYHLIAGEAPPNSQARLAAIAGSEADPCLPLSQKATGYDKSFLDAIDAALRVLPKDRIQEASEWLALIRDDAAKPATNTITPAKEPVVKLADTVASAAPKLVAPTQGTVTTGGAKKPRMGLLLASAAAVTVVGVVGVYSFGGSSKDAPVTVNVPTETAPIAKAAVAPAPVQVATPSPAPTTEIQAATATPEPAIVPEVAPVTETASAEPVPTPPAPTAEPVAVVTPEKAAEPVIVAAPVKEAPPFAAESIENPIMQAVPTERTRTAEVSVLPETRLNAPRAAENMIAPVANQKIDTGMPSDRGDLLVLPVVTAVSNTGLEPAGTKAGSKSDLVFPSVLPSSPSVFAASMSPNLAAPNATLEFHFDADTPADPPAKPEVVEEVVAVATPAPATVPSEVAVDTPAEVSEPEVAATASSTSDVLASDVSSVMSGWSATLPFTGSPKAPDTIGAITGPALPWMQKGVQIVAVNGQQITSLDEIGPMLRDTVDPGDAPMIQVAFSVVDSLTGAVSEQLAALPVVQEIVFLNGTRFEARFIDRTWQTKAVDIPAHVDTDLRAGDILVAYAANGEEISGPDTLAKILAEKASEKDVILNFTVLRDGGIWFATYSYKNAALN